MIYWLTGTAGSAAYVGYAQTGAWGAKVAVSKVPTAALVFAHDISIRRYVERAHTITRWTDVETGGHFAALEEPEILVGDVLEFFSDKA
jgi:pimeloyl-ACP methyl ester carboxylesterase